MGTFNWDGEPNAIDDVRNALLRYAKSRPEVVNGLLTATKELATNRNALVDALMRQPKPFQMPAEGDYSDLENAMNFGPSALVGMTRGALPKLAKEAAASEFVTGKPATAVGFHGSPSPELTFDPSRPAFISSHPEVANSYTAERGMWSRMPSDGATVYPAEVNFKNPLVIDAAGKRHDNVPVPWSEWKPKTFGNLPKGAVSVSELAEIAKAKGHDGLIVKNVVDTADIDGKTKSTVYAALVPDSITEFFSKRNKP